MADDIKVYEWSEDGELMLWFDRNTNTLSDWNGSVGVASEEEADALAGEWLRIFQR